MHRTALLAPLLAGLWAACLSAETPAPPFYADKAHLLVYQDGSGASQPIKSSADWAKRREHVLANMQRVMGPLPPPARKVPLDVKVLEEVALAKVVRKKITFAVEKDDRCFAYLLLPRTVTGKRPAMLALHQTTRIGKGEPAGVGGNANLHYGLELAERGYVVLAPDYPNYGDYQVDPYAQGYDSATMKGVWNHMRAVDLLQGLPEVDGARIGVIGHSLGGHNSLFVAAFDPRLQAVVTSCGFNAFPKYAGGNLAGWSHRGYMPKIATAFDKDPKKMPFDFTEILGSLAPRAVFINAPLKDSNFEVSGVADCVKAALPVYRLFGAQDRLVAHYPDAGHDFPPATRELAYQFLDRSLRQRVEFTRLVAHWDQYSDADYLPFIEEAKPEIAQVGFYGAHFWSMAHTPQGKGYPAHFPVQGLAECGKWFQDLNGELHKRKVKVVGHFNVGFLIGDPDGPLGPRGFFKFYRDLWDEKELGAKPVKNPLDLLEKDKDGLPRSTKTYSIGGMKEYHACLNNPHWRAVLKAWALRGIQRGIDGYMINYFYRHDCTCTHCQAGFQQFLNDRYTGEQLAEQFGIVNLPTHQFTEIVGWHDPKESTPLRRAMLQFSQVSSKAAYDEVFTTYARSLKADLILGQWNHLGAFSQINGDERCLLPAELWGRDEDYLWYSTGGAANFTDLAAGVLGEGTLQARYLRGAFDDKPVVLGKYEQTRTRAAIAELAANGGAPLGFYARFKDPAARQEIVRYYQFLEKNDAAYRAARPHSEAVLLYPRSRVHAGDVAAVETFKDLGRQLLDRHVLFDVLPDDVANAERLARYRQVVRAAEKKLPEMPADLSRFTAPATVRVSASRPANGSELAIHFVNYNRKEPEQKRSPGRGSVDDNPIAVADVQADVAIPAGHRVVKVRALTPETPEPVEVQAEVKDRRVRFTMPKFLVYGVARIELAPAP